MSLLVDRAIADAGLDEVLEARTLGAFSYEHLARLHTADLLALGALADRIRSTEVGAEVRVYADGVGDVDARVVAFPRADEDLTGLDLLRAIAMSRVTHQQSARIRVDWTLCGLEIAQIALGFGANELSGRIATKRGLPIAEGALSGVGKKSRLESAHAVKERELAGFIERAGRVPVFVNVDGTLRGRDVLVSQKEVQ
jgi:2-iminoacetate synthase ThiH